MPVVKNKDEAITADMSLFTKHKEVDDSFIQ
jgi:hypothetical protein